MSTERAQSDKSVASLVETIDELQEVLVRYKQATLRATQMMSSGVPAIETLTQIDAVNLRPELTDALARLEAARRQARVDLLAVAAQEGASPAEIGRALGFSRQLASRLANTLND